MKSSSSKRRFPPPWKAERTQHGFVVRDANGLHLASVYCRDDLHENRWDDYLKHLTSDEARRIAKAIARLPDLLVRHNNFEARGEGAWRWSSVRPYHVALEDAYVRENWDLINEIARLNGIPVNRTGERIESGTSWLVYEFAVQLDAIMFWDEFKGRWLREQEFIFPQRPNDLPVMRRPLNLERNMPKPGRR